MNGWLHQERREETSPVNLNSKTVPLQEAVNASTRQHPVLPHFLENESRLIADLSTAREVQQQLLQREVRGVQGIDLATAWVPARELGGDFYDVLPWGSGGLALALGDVLRKRHCRGAFRGAVDGNSPRPHCRPCGLRAGRTRRNQ